MINRGAFKLTFIFYLYAIGKRFQQHFRKPSNDFVDSNKLKQTKCNYLNNRRLKKKKIGKQKQFCYISSQQAMKRIFSFQFTNKNKQQKKKRPQSKTGNFLYIYKNISF